MVYLFEYNIVFEVSVFLISFLKKILRTKTLFIFLITSKWNNSYTFLGSYICTNCGRNYVQKSTLSRHQRYECGKGNQFKCPYCPKTTRQKYDIKLHVYKMHIKKAEEFEKIYKYI